MDKQLKAYKVEIKPTQEQKLKINKTLGVCRFIYNFYLATNQERYEKGEPFMSDYSFSKWLNNEFLPNHLEYSWVKEVGSKAVKQSIINANSAFKKFFTSLKKDKSVGYPKYKKRDDKRAKAYFPKNNETDLTVERHRIKIPTIGWTRLKEFGYLPKESEVVKIKSCTISNKADRYFISVLYEISESTKTTFNGTKSEGLGIDLGIKELAICSNGNIYGNINKKEKVLKLEKRLKREQRALNRKDLKRLKEKRPKEERSSNYRKNQIRVQRINLKLTNIKDSYIRYVIDSLVKTNPKFITIEDLNISGMMKNRHLSKAIQKQKFFYFKSYLVHKCKKSGIELRLVDRFYPSSKLCSVCGNKKDDLRLSDRNYICDKCGVELDRDYNASLNLRNCSDYKIA